LMYCLSPSMRVNSGDYIFSVMATPRDSLIAVMDYFKSRGLKRIAILNGTDATGADGDNILADIIKLPQFASMTYVANEHFNPGDLSVSAQITRIKASGAQVLIAYTTGAPTATVLHGMADGSLDIPVTTSAGNMSVAQLDSYKSFVPKELLFPAYPAQAVDPVADAVVLQRINDFKAAMKSISATPDLLHAIPWDATWLVVEALRRLRPAATAAQIRTSLAAVTNWPGMLGRYDFRAIPNRGLGPKALVMERWDPARSVWVLAK
jgi:branched-chain amino acid transport system substrate-binding protein